MLCREDCSLILLAFVDFQISHLTCYVTVECDGICFSFKYSSVGTLIGLFTFFFGLGDENGFNIPTVTLCPEVAKYLDLPLAVLALEQPRDMDGVAKRLFCDAYMYMYQSKKMALYK